MTTAEIKLWGRSVGAVSWDPEREYAFVEYESRFAQSGVEISPLKMPLAKTVYSFPALSRESFRGLPGLLADSLPDRFGNALVDSWLSAQGRAVESFNPVERLCYTGNRGMGALEFLPATGPSSKTTGSLDISLLVELANRALDEKKTLTTSLENPDDAVNDILRVGTSAGGARAKAIIAWNEKTDEIRSGHIKSQKGFSHWILKFDGIANNRDKEIADPQGFGLIEYAYYLMAKEAGIMMMPSRLLKEGGRSHFMTKRFDRGLNGSKLHMQSLGGIAHLDFNQAGAHSYEEALQVIRKLDLPMTNLQEQFRRMVFNIVARNQDDHVKNIAFLMNKSGQWTLSPAFDVTYSFNPSGAWTSRHQMTVNGKRDNFNIDDLNQCADAVALKKTDANRILEEVIYSVRTWASFAEEAGVEPRTAKAIEKTFRLKW